ncbi:MAG: hypothetical protein ACRBC3_08595 [Burkholderiaceae bacterium]
MPRQRSEPAKAARTVSRSVLLTATWDNCPASSPAMRSSNALLFATRIALINQGLMAPGDHHQPGQRADLTDKLRLNSGELSVSAHPLQRRCVLVFDLVVKTADEMAAVHAVIRSVSQVLGTDRQPVVAMETGQSKSAATPVMSRFESLGSLAFGRGEIFAGA